MNEDSRLPRLFNWLSLFLSYHIAFSVVILFCDLPVVNLLCSCVAVLYSVDNKRYFDYSFVRSVKFFHVLSEYCRPSTPMGFDVLHVYMRYIDLSFTYLLTYLLNNAIGLVCDKTYLSLVFSVNHISVADPPMCGLGGRSPPIDQNLGLVMAARLRHGGKFSLKSLTFGHLFESATAPGVRFSVFCYSLILKWKVRHGTKIANIVTDQ